MKEPEKTHAMGHRIADRRKKLGLSQADLARAVGIAQPNINALEKGRVKKPRYILELAQSLGVTPGWLTSGESHKEHANDEAPQILREFDLNLLGLSIEKAVEFQGRYKISRAEMAREALLYYAGLMEISKNKGQR